MGVFDRSVLANNDQNNGQVSDITKLEAIHTAIADEHDKSWDYLSGLIAGGTLQPYPAFMSRQALINGNFDVWQRGTSLSPSTNGITYTADRWATFAIPDGGTIPSFTAGLLYDTPTGAITAPQGGSIAGTIVSHRISTSGAITGHGPNMQLELFQKIEHGVRKLCGAGKKVTVSFWARCDAANKRLGVWLVQNYGSGGSPNAQEGIVGTSFTLTGAWQKYSFTFTTNTIAGKTFGSNNDDTLTLIFQLAWGANNRGAVGSSTDENLIAGAAIDISQVQVCAGDQSLPFQPRSFAEELALCQRYYEKSGNYAQVLGSGTVINAAAWQIANNKISNAILYKVQKRTSPSVTLYDNVGAIGKALWIIHGSTSVSLTSSVNNNSELGFSVASTATDNLAINNVAFSFASDAEL